MKNKQIDIPKLAPGTTLIDSHCHLDMEPYANVLAETINGAVNSGVTRVVTVGIDLQSSRRAVGLAREFPEVFATIGIHPHNAADADEESYRQLQLLTGDPQNKVIGYGEIGLDFARNYAPRETQIECFEKQLEIAKDLHLPIIIHDRDAHDETMEILQNHSPFPAGGVMHCFSGDIALADKVLALGLHISIPGIVTFANSDAMQEVAKEIPLNRLLLETDGPFLTPVPYRGKPNRPEFLLYTARKIAHLREISLADIARQTTLNAEALFQLPKGDLVQ